MGLRHSPAALAEACRLVHEAGGCVAEAARRAGLPQTTLYNRVAAAVRAGLADPRQGGGLVLAGAAAPAPSAVERRQVMRLREQLAQKRRELEGADAAANLADAIRQARGALCASPVEVPSWAVHVKATNFAPGVPVLLLTDWHIGETVRAPEVYHSNQFDEATADARVRLVTERAIALTTAAAPRSVEGGVVFLGGDFVSGWLHEELVRSDWCSPLEAVRWCVGRLTWALRQLRDAWGRLYVCGVPGNHGRLSKRPPGKGHAAQSYDFLIYGLLADAFAGDPHVTISAPEDGEQAVQIAATRYLLMHGHQLGVSGGDGIIGAIGPVMRGATKVGRSQRSVGRDFDVLVLGHFHQWLHLPSVIVGPTLKGFDEYARVSRFSFEPASQLLWWTHPQFGAHSPIRVFAQDPMRARQAVPFVALEAA